MSAPTTAYEAYVMGRAVVIKEYDSGSSPTVYSRIDAATHPINAVTDHPDMPGTSDPLHPYYTMGKDSVSAHVTVTMAAGLSSSAGDAPDAPDAPEQN